jgi:predicted patatin/cPLA2 family phospholipase
MEQIIGGFKEFIVLERGALNELEYSATQKLKANEDRGLSESYIEAKAVLEVVQWIKENNIYNKDFKFKG